MSRTFLFAVLFATLLVLSAAQASSSSSSGSAASSSSTGTSTTLTFCQKYSATTTNATLQVALISAVVTRAATGGIYTYTDPTTGTATTYEVFGLLNSTGPLYNIFSGKLAYRVGAPDYTSSTNGALTILAGKLVAYFGALFGCTATGYPAVTTTYNMYAVHANMSINSTMETYFNTALYVTLQTFGVATADLTAAGNALALFNRCAAPIAALNTTAPVQVCGTNDCALASGATYTTCESYYAYPTSSSTAGSSDATGVYALSAGVSFVLAAVAATFVL